MTKNPLWDGETYAIVKAMKATGNQPGVIARWKEFVELWAISRPGDKNAEAILVWLPHWQVRPFYTAEELAPMWPALSIAIEYTNIWPAVPKSAKRLEFELDYVGLPRLGSWPEFTDNLSALRRKYFIVERLHYWQQASADEIEREFDAQR